PRVTAELADEVPVGDRVDAVDADPVDTLVEDPARGEREHQPPGREEQPDLALDGVVAARGVVVLPEVAAPTLPITLLGIALRVVSGPEADVEIVEVDMAVGVV